MATLTWPSGRDWLPCRMEMRVSPNTRSFPNPFSPGAEQVVDLFGDYWMLSLDLTPVKTDAQAAEREAFFDALNNRGNKVLLWHFRQPRPRGTVGAGTGVVSVVNGSLAAVSVVNGSLAAVTVVSGTPMLAAPVAAMAVTGTLVTYAGRTMKAGDLFAMPNGEVKRQRVDTVADGSGNMPIDFRPAQRVRVETTGVINVDAPTIAFRSRGDTPVVYRPGYSEGVSIDLVEAV